MIVLLLICQSRQLNYRYFTNGSCLQKDNYRLLIKEPLQHKGSQIKS